MPMRNQKKRGHGEWPFSQPKEKWKHSAQSDDQLPKSENVVCPRGTFT